MKLNYDGNVRRILVGNDYFLEKRNFEDTDTVVLLFECDADVVTHLDNLLYKAYSKLSVDRSAIVHCAYFEPLVFNLGLLGDYPCVMVMTGETYNNTVKDIDSVHDMRRILVTYEKISYIHEEVFKPNEVRYRDTVLMSYGPDEVAYVVPTTDIDRCADINMPKNVLKVMAVHRHGIGSKDSSFCHNISLKTVRMEYSYDFNFSRINNEAVAYLREFKPSVRYVILCNDDVKLFQDTTANLLNPLFKDQKVGIVGAKLLFNDDTIQHFGVGYNRNRMPYHVSRHAPANDVTVSAYQSTYDVTFALVALRVSVFKTVKFDERFVYDFNDIDFCLKARSNGWKIICNPRAVAYHLESFTRKDDKRQDSKAEIKLFLEKHGRNIR